MEPVDVFSVEVWESEALVLLRPWELSSDICAVSGVYLISASLFQVEDAGRLIYQGQKGEDKPIV